MIFSVLQLKVYKTGTVSVFKGRILVQDYQLSWPEPSAFKVSVTGRTRALETTLVLIEFIKFHERN